MKNLSIIIIVLIAAFSITSCTENVNNGKHNFNADWKFKLLEETNGPEAEYQKPEYDDSGWKAVRLPHTAHLEPQVVNNQWQGNCWYRKSFLIPKNYKNKKVFIELEAAMNYSKIWVNGSLLTEHQGGYLPVVIDISEHLKIGAENIIAVRLNNTDNAVTGPKPLKILDYNMYGGLYRNAWMTVKNKVHITHANFVDKVAGGGIFITTPKVSEAVSSVHVKAHIQNEESDEKTVQVVQSILFEGKVVKENTSETLIIAAGKGADFIADFSVENSKLWSPKSPSLYQLETKVLVDGKEVDTETTRFGIRKFEFKNNQFYINGEKTFLRGTNRHQEYPFVGYALSDNAQYRDALKIKEGGFDYIRLSHYPHSPAFMDACDELGLVNIDAISGWQYYLDNDDFRNYCYNSAQQLIRRDRNRPSVMGWEVSLNETQMPIFFMEEIHKIARAEDPRPDAYTCGWKPEVYDIYLQARQHRIMHPTHEHHKPYSVSEYGDWEYYSSNAGLNQDKMDKQTRYVTSSRQKREYGEARLLQQATNVQEAHNDNFSTTAYSDSYWVMYDYNRGYHDDIEYSGLMDIFRLPKFGYYFYQSQRDTDEKIVCQLATYWNEKSPLNVRVFSNCDEVELFLNGKSLGKQTPNKNEISNNLNHPPFTFNIEKFEAGDLKALAYINGKKVAEHLVKTPGKASGLKIWIDESGKAPQTGCSDIVFAYIAAIDENGTVIPDYSEKVNLKINGGAALMNVGDIEAEAGIATAVLQIGDIAGNVSLNADSKGFSGELTFDVK